MLVGLQERRFIFENHVKIGDGFKMNNIWYSTLIYESLKVGLSVSLFISDDGCLGVKIDDIYFPYFAWESFEEQTETQEEFDKAMVVNRKIIDTKLKSCNDR